MNCTDVSQLFRFYADEEDLSFLDKNTVSALLKFGYNEFRRFVSNYDPMGYANVVNFTINSQPEYDLGGTTNPVRILGPTPTNPRMMRLTSLAAMNADGTIKQLYRGAGNIEELRRIGYGAGDGYMQGVGPYYLLRNTTLVFGIPVTETFQITYVPVSTVDWSKIGPSDNEFIDNYEDWQDLIAMFALRHYYITDGSNNPRADALLAARTDEFKDYLAYGRNPQSGDHVTREY